jgi:hypothetical protein
MRAVAIKTGQMSGEQGPASRKWASSGVTVAGRSSSLHTSPRSRIGGSLRNKRIGSKRSVRKSTSGKRNTPTGSNCRTEAITATPPSLCRPFAILLFLPHVMRIFPSSCRDDLADLSRYR